MELRGERSDDGISAANSGQQIRYITIDPFIKLNILFSETTMIGDRTIVGQLRIPITPIIDGEILPRPVEELRFMEPRRRKIIAGITEFEGLLFCEFFSSVFTLVLRES